MTAYLTKIAKVTMIEETTVTRLQNPKVDHNAESDTHDLTTPARF